MFYGPPKSRTPSPSRERNGSGSEAETEIEEPVKKFKRLHRRLDSADSTLSSSSGERQERKRSKTSLSKVSARDTHGRQPLQRACARGDFERVVALVKDGADIIDRDYAGTTALHSAALQGDAKTVEFLLENGAIADIRSGPDELDTPLMDAVSSSNVPVIKLLLKHGADPRVQNAEGKTTIDFINDEADEAEEIHELLKQESLRARKQGPPILAPADGPKGMFPPQLSSQTQAAGTGTGAGTSAASSRPRRRNDLLWFDVTTRTGRSEVCKRAAQGDIEYIGMSLEHGWQPSAEALVQAAKFGHTDVVGLLLAFGTSPDDLYEGVTALHETIGRGHLEVVKLLIEGGANPKWKDSNGRGYPELVKDLPADDEERQYIETVCTQARQTAPDHSKSNEKRLKQKTREDKVDKADAREAPRDIKEERDAPRHKKDSKDSRPLKREPKDVKTKESKEPKIPKALKESKSSKGTGDTVDSQESKPLKESKRPRDSQELTERTERGESEDLKPSNEAKNPQGIETKAAEEPKDLWNAPAKELEGPKEHLEVKLNETNGHKDKNTELNLAESRKPKEIRVRFDDTGKPPDHRKSLDRTSPGMSPRSAQSPHQTAEEIQRLEELAAKRERARKAREAEILSALEKQEKRAAERRERLSGEFDRATASPPPVSVSPVPQSTTALSPAALSDVATPTGSEPGAAETAVASPGAVGDAPARVPFTRVANLPYALRSLSVLGTPQDARPLLVYRKKGVDYVLDVQLALVLGNARLHAEHPELTKVQVTAELPALWGLVFMWMAPRKASVEELQTERAKFEGLKLHWIPLSEAVKLTGAESIPTVRISLEAPAPSRRTSTTNYENIPLRLSAQISANRASSQWY